LLVLRSFLLSVIAGCLYSSMPFRLFSTHYHIFLL
jgi:hypothetical protein